MKRHLRIVHEWNFPGQIEKRRSSASALVLTLVTLVLLTVLILAFFSQSILNRQISFSSTSLTKADLLARSSLDVITGELRNEITDTNRSTATTNSISGSPTIYIPKSSADLPPASEGVVSPSGPIVKVSANSVPIRPNGTIVGSSITIDTPSLNGRALSSWFSATNSGPQLGTNGVLPTWLFATRGNGIKIPATISTAMNPTNGDYVVGRFAYTIYDLSQLFDANAAGYPNADATNAAYKSCLAYADLSQLPSISSTNNVDSFVSWRNAQDYSSPVYSSPVTNAYSSYLQNYGIKYGFLQTELGDNAFLSRQDLINFANSGSYGLTASSLAYLTHFSRSVNAPTWSPINPPTNPGGAVAVADQEAPAYSTNYTSLAETAPNPNRDIPNVRFANASTITHYRDDGTTQTYSVLAGDPLVQCRFSLTRLFWLTYKGPSATNLPSTDPVYQADLTNGISASVLAGGTAAAIQSCFGLAWDSANWRWSYVGSLSAGGTTPLTAIETLDQVAAENREPNFFELLKAGILAGSVGIANTNQTNNNGKTVDDHTSTDKLDSVKDLQVLGIGANIIDCSIRITTRPLLP
jgi:hypothetical protein